MQTWQDIKSVAKKKKSIIRNYQNGTGGGPSIDIKLTTEEEKVIDILGPIVTEGDLQIPESSCSFVFDDHTYSTVKETQEEVMIEDSSGHIEEDIAIELITEEEETQKYESDDEAMNEGISETKVTPKRKYIDKHLPEVISNSKTKKAVRVQRLEHSINANDQLVKLSEKKIKLKENYLSLYKRDVTAKETIASTLQQLCSFFHSQSQ